MASKTDLSTKLLAALEQLQQQVAQLTERVARLEGPAAAMQSAAPAEAVPEAPPLPPPIPEETVLIIAAAIAAYLGKRANIRHIRLIGSAPWAQQGRVSVQASHSLERTHS